MNHFTVPCVIRHFFQVCVYTGHTVAQPAHSDRDFGRRSSVRRVSRGEAKSFGRKAHIAHVGALHKAYRGPPKWPTGARTNLPVPSFSADPFGRRALVEYKRLLADARDYPAAHDRARLASARSDDLVRQRQLGQETRTSAASGAAALRGMSRRRQSDRRRRRRSPSATWK